MEEEANLISRIFAGCIVSAVGFAPSYVCGTLLYWLFTGREELSNGILVAIAISAIIAAPFYLLAYRLFTGRGRKKDGGLISPYFLIIMSVLIVLLGLSIAVLHPNGDAMKSIIGGCVFVLMGISGLSLSIKRIKKNA